MAGLNAGINRDTPYGRYLQSHGKRGFDWRYPAAMAAPIAAAYAAPFLAGMGGGGSAAATSAATAAAPTASAATAPVVAGGVSRLLSHPLANVGAQGIFGFLQSRSANKANERATREQMSFADRQLAVEQQRLADERADMMAARSEDQRRWEADEAYRRSLLERDNERDAYERSIVDERQNRLRAFDPYRQMALARLGRFLR